MSKILVTGAAGYIGSHACIALADAGYEAVGVDNLSYGRAEAVLPPARLEIFDLADLGQLEKLFAKEKFSGIIHFAGSIVVPESVEKPLKYYVNNTTNLYGLLDIAARHHVRNIIFSSSAAVYGKPQSVPIPETAPLKPINPYGRTKLISEWAIRDMAVAHPETNYALLRYFNVAGADPEGRVGENRPRATHLINVACKVAVGKQDRLFMYGDDYPTPDGTCVRDYMHVTDLAEVHVAALKYLEQGGDSGVFNCGYGHGFSVREIVDTVKKVSGNDFPVDIGPRRLGDSPELVADPAKIMKAMDWKPRLDDIETIVSTALEWEKKLEGQ